MKTSIEISSVLGEEKKVLEQLEEILQQIECCERDSMDIKTAVAEACLNAIEHGNGLNSGLNVNTHIQIMDNTVIVEVYDHGKGSELQALTGDEAEKGEGFRGWGLCMIDRLVDAWEYFYDAEDRLFCVRMKKKISKGR